MKNAYDSYSKEWNDLSRRANAYLAEPHSIPKAENLDRWCCLLRLWHHPSFRECRAWGIYRIHEAGSRLVKTVVRQITWDQSFDSKRFFSPLEGLEHGLHPQPTIEVRDRPVDSPEMDRQLALLERISFNLFASSPIGLDGETFGVEIPRRHARAEWWCEGPEEWSALAEWASNVREWLSKIASEEPDRALWQAPKPNLP